MAAKNAKQLKIRDEANDVLEQNKDCEQAIITMVKDTKDCNNMSNIDILSSASLAMFASLNVVMLSSFYKARYLNDLTQKLILPNKGTFEKVQYKEKDKKTNGPYLIQLSYDTKSLPVIGTIPVIKAIELPTMLVKPPTVVRFETSNKTIVQEHIDLKWLDDVSTSISSISNLVGVTYYDEHRRDMIEINQYATTCSDNLLKRLHPFLRTRIPLHRTDLLPGRHWVWNSLRMKLKKKISDDDNEWTHC